MGDMGDAYQESSLRGIEFGGTYRFETNVTVGGTMSYSAFFYKTEPQTVTWDNGTKALTARALRDLYSYAFMAEGGYAYKNNSDLTPFFKLGIGAYYTEQYSTVGLLAFYNDDWDFGMRPELGFYYVPEFYGIGFLANVKYNWIPKYEKQNLDTPLREDLTLSIAGVTKTETFYVGAEVEGIWKIVRGSDTVTVPA